MTENDWIGIKDGDRVALQMPNLYHSGWIRLFVKGQWQRQWKARAIIDWLSIASSDIKAEIDSKPWPLDVSHRALAGDQPESRISFEIVNNSRRGLYVNVGPVNLRTGLVQVKNAAFDNYLGVDTRKQMRGDPGDLVIISDDVTQEFVASVELLSSDQIITID